MCVSQRLNSLDSLSIECDALNFKVGIRFSEKAVSLDDIPIFSKVSFATGNQVNCPWGTSGIKSRPKPCSLINLASFVGESDQSQEIESDFHSPLFLDVCQIFS